MTGSDITDKVSDSSGAETARAPKKAHPAPPGARLDPRTKVGLVLVTSVTVMAPGGAVFVPAALGLAVVLALVERAWTRGAGLLAVAAVAASLAYLLPRVVVHPLIGVVGVFASYTLRFLVVTGVVAHLVRTTTPSEFTAALRAARIPRGLTVSGAVMLRFVPTVIAEARAVRDAMRLRGLGLFGDPIRGIEYFTIPLIASSLRASEDLSASALLRGLGSRARPTSMYPPRFGIADAMVTLFVALLAGGTVLW
ncbi:energy-coupling factor transporter transmembrane component T [Nocardia paucivorans]|uniref:energy-coupling factor transporter transmembrane component T n=1 Tax=Nocardia paucivorans TaxID=114259 RepID=UPI0002EAFB93|nr:energy-coupling factor transporter transmembrane component T [Nocardia paucivorans]